MPGTHQEISVFRARRTFSAVLVCCGVIAAPPASAQAASITVDQACIDPGTAETGGGKVSGTVTGAPTGERYGTPFISADRYSGDDWTHFGGDYAQVDAQGNGTFSFHIGYYGSSLPDTVFVKGRVFDRELWAWSAPFAETAVPVCGRQPAPEPDADSDGVPDSADNCPAVANADQLDQNGDGVGNACDLDQDGDGASDGADNCALAPNADQRDTDIDGIGDECDPFPGSTAGCRVTLGGHAAVGGERVTFGGNAQAKTLTDVAGQLEYTDHGQASAVKFKSLTVDSAVCSAGSATVRGTGTANGQSITYRIDVRDSGEPATSDTYRIQLSSGYDSGERQLSAGNVQVHS